MNRVTGFQSQNPMQGSPKGTSVTQRDGIKYVKGVSSGARIGFLSGLAVALVGEGASYQKVLHDLMGVRAGNDIPSGILLFAKRHSSALSNEELDALASQAVSVANAGSRQPEEVQAQLLEEFVHRKAQIMKIFKPA